MASLNGSTHIHMGVHIIYTRAHICILTHRGTESLMHMQAYTFTNTLDTHILTELNHTGTYTHTDTHKHTHTHNLHEVTGTDTHSHTHIHTPTQTHRFNMCGMPSGLCSSPLLISPAQETVGELFVLAH